MCVPVIAECGHLARRPGKKQIAEKARPGESAGEPVLSYDRGPSRLAWAVRLTRAGGGVRTVFVAGRTVWEEVEGGEGDSYGGRSS